MPADLLDAIAKSNPHTLQGFGVSGFWSRGFGPVIRASYMAVMNNTVSFLGFGPRVSGFRVSLGSGVPDIVPADLVVAIAKSNPQTPHLAFGFGVRERAREGGREAESQALMSLLPCTPPYTGLCWEYVIRRRG